MPRSAFGKRLKEVFGNATNQEIADKLGVSAPAVQNYVSGRIPDGEKLQTIAKVTNCNLHWLLTGEGESNNNKNKLTFDEVFESKFKQLITELNRTSSVSTSLDVKSNNVVFGEFQKTVVQQLSELVERVLDAFKQAERDLPIWVKQVIEDFEYGTLPDETLFREFVFYPMNYLKTSTEWVLTGKGVRKYDSKTDGSDERSQYETDLYIAFRKQLTRSIEYEKQLKKSLEVKGNDNRVRQIVRQEIARHLEQEKDENVSVDVPFRYQDEKPKKAPAPTKKKTG